eukprot:2339235-Amphidinium_carterae.4
MSEARDTAVGARTCWLMSEARDTAVARGSKQNIPTAVTCWHNEQIRLSALRVVKSPCSPWSIQQDAQLTTPIRPTKPRTHGLKKLACASANSHKA